jgi:hypothetical protein
VILQSAAVIQGLVAVRTGIFDIAIGHIGTSTVYQEIFSFYQLL